MLYYTPISTSVELKKTDGVFTTDAKELQMFFSPMIIQISLLARYESVQFSSLFHRVISRHCPHPSSFVFSCSNKRTPLVRVLRQNVSGFVQVLALACFLFSE